VLFITVLPLIAIILVQFFTGKPVGDHPASNTILLLLIVFIFLPIFLFFYFFKLTTRIDENTIYYGFFSLNELKWDDVKEASLIKYSFFGFGYKISREYGEVYNTRGNMGLWITTQRGGKILIGTNKPDELKAFLEAIGR